MIDDENKRKEEEAKDALRLAKQAQKKEDNDAKKADKNKAAGVTAAVAKLEAPSKAYDAAE